MLAPWRARAIAPAGCWRSGRRRCWRRCGRCSRIERALAAAKEETEAKAASARPLEKTALKVGFVPITCATPIIMAQPMGFYKKYGLDVEVVKTAGWAVARDKSLSQRVRRLPHADPDAAGDQPGRRLDARCRYTVPAIENMNGQAITLSLAHKDKRDPKQWKGLKFAVPFEFSMHNFLLRYYVAEHGLDPDKDIQIRVVPPPEMVANLKAGNVDGYLAPDPFNQRAVLREGRLHPPAVARRSGTATPAAPSPPAANSPAKMPNTFGALFRAIVDATHYAAEAEHRKEIAAAIAPQNYLNQPPTVVEQVLTGRFADGLGNVQEVPDRIDFNPFPWHSMAVWILTQMKRWGYIKGDVDYKKVAEQVYLAADCGKLMKELGYTPPASSLQEPHDHGQDLRPRQAAPSTSRASPSGRPERVPRASASARRAVAACCWPRAAGCCGRRYAARRRRRRPGAASEYDALVAGAERGARACRRPARWLAWRPAT